MNYRLVYRTIVLDEYAPVAFVLSVEHLFIIGHKSRTGGIYKQGCRCSERLRGKAGGGGSYREVSHTLGGAGEWDTSGEGSG